MENLFFGWAVELLGKLCSITTGSKDVNEGNPVGQYPFFTCAQEISKCNAYSFDGAAILIAGNGNFSVKKYEGKFEAYQRTYVLQNFAIDHYYLFYFISHRLGEITKDNFGSTIRYIRIGNLTDYPVSFPSINEQHRIVAKIEELFSELDQGVASLKTAREQLKVYRQSLLKNAFEGKLTATWRAAHRDQLETAAALQQRIAHERQSRHHQQLADWQANGQPGPKPKLPKPLPPLTAEELAELPELPAGWFGGRLGWMTCGVEYGTAAKSAEQGACPVLRMGNIQNGKFNWASLVFTDDLEEIAKYRLSEGDVLFNRTNSPELVGKSAVFKGGRSALFAGYLIRVNQIPSIVLSGYLNYFLNSPIARQHGNTVKTDGVNQSNINGEKLINYPFPFCGIEEQNQIVQELESKLSEADQLDQTLATALQQADALRQSILKKAFHGQLVKQDKNEEPATALLERIRAGKSNGIKKPVKQGKAG